MAIYLASPARLPLVTWNEERPAFYVEEAAPDHPVRRQFRWPNVYYAGSHEGCGCGFAYGQMPDALQEPVDEAQRRGSLEALRKYIGDASRFGPIQFFACWEGEQTSQLKDRVEAMPSALGGAAFQFEQLRMLEFPDTGHPPPAANQGTGGA